MSIIDQVFSYAERSDHIDTEHVLPLSIGVAVAVVFYLDIDIIKSLFRSIDNTMILTVFDSAFQGVIAGIVTTFLYTTGERSFRVGDRMKSKEKSLSIVFTVMLGLGYLVSQAAPAFTASLEYASLQLAGLVFALGLLFVHLLIDTWRLTNEWPHLLAAGLVFIAPYI